MWASWRIHVNCLFYKSVLVLQLCEGKWAICGAVALLGPRLTELKLYLTFNVTAKEWHGQIHLLCQNLLQWLHPHTLCHTLWQTNARHPPKWCHTVNYNNFHHIMPMFSQSEVKLTIKVMCQCRLPVTCWIKAPVSTISRRRSSLEWLNTSPELSHWEK